MKIRGNPLKMDSKPAEQPPPLLQPPTVPPPPSPALGRQTFLGRGVTIRGQIVASEDLFIDGVIEAPIHCKSHSITLGPNSRIAGNIEAKSVEVRGEMEGDILADQSVHIGRGALVTGSVRAQSVQLDSSARVRVQLLVGMGPETSK